MSAFAQRVANMRDPRPYPLGPLADALGIPPADTATLSLRLGINRRWIRRYRTWGLTERQADQWACRAGIHPADVWPRWEDWHLRGTALLNANRVECPRHRRRYDRVDANGRRRCSLCVAEASKRYRNSRKAQVVAVMTGDRDPCCDQFDCSCDRQEAM